MALTRIFISSVQSEFGEERAALRNHIREDPWMSQLFEVFLFEDTPASDQRPDMLYLEEVARCDIYIGLFGAQYGSSDKEGVSPTEREFDRASELGKHRLVYLKRIWNQAQDPRIKLLIDKAQNEVVRKSFTDVEVLKREVSKSLSKYWSEILLCAALADSGRCRTSKEAEEVLQSYQETAAQVYAVPDSLAPFDCVLQGREISSDEFSRIICETNGNILLKGPSGCGKSHLAADTVLEFVRRGDVALIVRIKNYTDSLMTILDREIELLDVRSSNKLFSAAQMLERSILLVADGYNECDGSRRESLTLELAAMARRYKANILITSQVPLARPDVLVSRTVEVPRTAMETKIGIARNAMDVHELPKDIRLLLGAVSTGLEAKLVAEVGQQLDVGSSRFALFDAYTRKCLNNMAVEGISALSHVAAWLCDRVSFSLTVRDLDRLMAEERIGHAVSGRLQAAGLLSSQGNRVSFVHEMFFNAFAAEAVVRHSAGQSEAILKALEAPLHSERKDFIIGAIDEQLLLENVLGGLSDYTSVWACLSGSCGVRARDWAEARYTRLLSQLHEEVRDVRFKVVERGFKSVTFDEDRLTAWNSLDQAFIAALPKLILEGRYLDDILVIIGTLDERINDECVRLSGHGQELDFSLRSEMFEISFAFGNGPTPGIAKVCASVGNNVHCADGGRLVKFLEKRLAEDRISDGQLYLLLSLARALALDHFATMTTVIAQFLSRTISMRWNQAPYHLALHLLETAGSCHFASEAEKAALIQALESLLPCNNIWLASSITEALQFLGAFEESEFSHRTVIHKEVRRCLASPNEKTHTELAYTIYSRQFDHPFCRAYFEILAGLPSQERKQLLLMAANGADEGDFFLGILIDELASFGDPKVGQALTRFTGLPPTRCGFPQKAVDVFITTHVAFARLGLSLSTEPEFTNFPPAECMTASGSVLYWINRNDLDEGGKRNKCGPAFSVLRRYRQSATLEVLRLCDPHNYLWSERYLKSVNRSVIDYFPGKSVELCHGALNQPEELLGYFNFNKNEAMEYAIRVLAQYGGNENLPPLRKYIEDRYLGAQAIDAMKRIEERELDL